MWYLDVHTTDREGREEKEGGREMERGEGGGKRKVEHKYEKNVECIKDRSLSVFKAPEKLGAEKVTVIV